MRQALTTSHAAAVAVGRGVSSPYRRRCRLQRGMCRGSHVPRTKDQGGFGIIGLLTIIAEYTD